MALSDLIVNISGNARDFARALDSGETRLNRFVTSGIKGIGRLGLALGGLTITGLAGLGVAAVKLAADAEQAEAAIASLLGSKAKAQSLLRELQGFATETPLDEGEINSAARMLLGFGSEAGGVTDELRTLGDISAGVQMQIGDLAEIYGKARQQGTLFAEDINQLTGRGIPIISELARVLGVAETKVKKLGSQGKIHFSHLEQAFKNLTSEGGKFSGMLEEMAETTKGKFNRLKGAATSALRDIGDAIINEFDIKGLTDDLNGLVENFRRDWVPIIVEGIRKAAMEADGLLVTFEGLVHLSKDFASHLDQANQHISDISALLGGGPKNLFELAFPQLDWLLDIAKARGEAERLKNEALEIDKAIRGLDRLGAGTKFLELPEPRTLAEKIKGLFNKGDLIPMGAGPAAEMPKPELATAGGGLRPDDFRAFLSSTEVGSRQAFEKIFAAMGGVKQQKPQQQTAKNTEKTAKTLDRIERLLDKIEQKTGEGKIVNFAP